MFDNEEVFLVDNQGHRIVVCRPDGSFVRSFGSCGKGDGEYRFPWSIAADGKGLLYIADSMNSRVCVMHRDGSFVSSIGTEGSEEGQFRSPYGVALNDDKLCVTDQDNYRIQVAVRCFV